MRRWIPSHQYITTCLSPHTMLHRTEFSNQHSTCFYTLHACSAQNVLLICPTTCPEKRSIHSWTTYHISQNTTPHNHTCSTSQWFSPSHKLSLSTHFFPSISWTSCSSPHAMPITVPHFPSRSASLSHPTHVTLSYNMNVPKQCFSLHSTYTTLHSVFDHIAHVTYPASQHAAPCSIWPIPHSFLSHMYRWCPTPRNLSLSFCSHPGQHVLCIHTWWVR